MDRVRKRPRRLRLADLGGPIRRHASPKHHPTPHATAGLPDWAPAAHRLYRRYPRSVHRLGAARWRRPAANRAGGVLRAVLAGWKRFTVHNDTRRALDHEQRWLRAASDRGRAPERRRLGMGGCAMTVSNAHRLLPLIALLALATAFGVSAGTAAAQTTDGRIVFQGCDVTTCQIYTVNPDGTALRQVTHGAAARFQPDWSPNGRHIVFAQDSGSGSAIWIARADGSSPPATHPLPGFSDQWPHFTPDGRRVLFTNFTPDTDGGISSIRPDGTHLRVITPTAASHTTMLCSRPTGALRSCAGMSETPRCAYTRGRSTAGGSGP